MKRFLVLLAMFAAIGINNASAEEYILRIEDLIYRDADFQAVKELHNDTSAAERAADDNDHAKPDAKSEEEVEQAIEIQIRPGARFYSKTVVGNKTVTVSGELIAAGEPGQFRLNVKRNSTEPTGRIITDANGRKTQDAPIKTFATQQRLEVGKKYVLGPIATGPAATKPGLFSKKLGFGEKKGTYIVHTFRLEAAKTAN